MQTSYSTQVQGFAGGLADTCLRDVISRINENASAILFGLGVKRGSAVSAGATGLFDESSSAADDLLGVTLHDFAVNNASETDQSIPADNTGSILRKGRIFVIAETAVTDGADAYVRIANGVADATQTTKGGWGADDDSGTRRHVKGAKFRSAAAKGGVAVLELNGDFGSYDEALFQERIGEGDSVVYTTPVSEGDMTELVAAVTTISATTTVQLGVSPSTASRLKAAYLDATVAAGDSTDHWTIALKVGATSLATWDTDVGVDGGLTKDTPSAMNLVANTTVTAADEVTCVFTKNNAAANFTVAGTVTAQLETDVLVTTTTVDLGTAPGDAACSVAVKDTNFPKKGFIQKHIKFI